MRVKLCPNCGAKNDPKSIECKECGSSIIEVQITEAVDHAESDKELNNIALDQPQIKSPKLYVKICPCGWSNAANAIYCEKCQEDLSYVFPSLKGEQEEIKTEVSKEELSTKTLLNTSTKDSYGKRIIRISTLDHRSSEYLKDRIYILGRETFFSKYLSTCSFVSRKHAEILITNEAIIIKDLNSTNGTFVNGEKVDPVVGNVLKNGDLISLGGIIYQGKQNPKVGYLKISIETNP